MGVLVGLVEGGREGKGKGWTNSGDFFAFSLNVLAEVLLYPAHCYNCVVAECLDYLER